MTRELGKELRRIRKLSGMKQFALAAFLGTTQQFISQMEQGERPLTEGAFMWILESALVGKYLQKSELTAFLEKVGNHGATGENSKNMQSTPENERNANKTNEIESTEGSQYGERGPQVLVGDKKLQMLVSNLLKRKKISQEVLAEIVGSETFSSYEFWSALFKEWWWKEYNPLCMSCKRDCKQSSQVIIECCPQFEEIEESREPLAEERIEI